MKKMFTLFTVAALCFATAVFAQKNKQAKKFRECPLITNPFDYDKIEVDSCFDFDLAFSFIKKYGKFTDRLINEGLSGYELDTAGFLFMATKSDYGDSEWDGIVVGMPSKNGLDYRFALYRNREIEPYIWNAKSITMLKSFCSNSNFLVTQ